VTPGQIPDLRLRQFCRGYIGGKIQKEGGQANYYYSPAGDRRLLEKLLPENHSAEREKENNMGTGILFNTLAFQ
jgi:hypothetical protein